LLGQVRDRLEVLWIACHKGTLLQLGKDIGDIVFVGKVFNVTKYLGPGEVGEGILDSGLRC
jgi:hypothetical protein